MDTPARFVLTYRCDDPSAQADLKAELRSFGRLIVGGSHVGDDYFVVIETDGDVAAITVHELVMLIDPHAELVDTQAASNLVENRRLDPIA